MDRPKGAMRRLADSTLVVGCLHEQCKSERTSAWPDPFAPPELQGPNTPNLFAQLLRLRGWLGVDGHWQCPPCRQRVYGF